MPLSDNAIQSKHCVVCEKRIPKSYPPLCCDICKTPTHYKCQGLSRSDSSTLLQSSWSCYSCISSILPIGATETDTKIVKEKSPKIRCHSCLGWSYSINNVRVCCLCDKTVHVKCFRNELGCVRCCEENIPGYHVDFVALNDCHAAFTNDRIFNPYCRSHVINSIGDRIDEIEQNNEHWNAISDLLLRCEYKMPLNVKLAQPNELKVFTLNIRSLQKNITRMREDIASYSKYDVISLNETNCAVDKLPNGLRDVILDGFYDPIIQEPARKSGKGGGLAIYINKRVASPENIESFTPNYNGADDASGEFQFVKIHNCKGLNKTKIIINTYRSPSKKFETFTDILENVLRALDRHSRKHILLTGDLNVDLIKYDNDICGQNLIAVLEKYGFVQLCSKPTRVTDHSATLIDHVYTNDVSNIISCNVVTVDLSDHLATLTTLSLGGNHQKQKNARLSRESSFQTRVFNSANDYVFKNLIASETWNEVYSEECAERQYDKFCDIYSNIYNQAYPQRNKGPRRKYERRDPKPWILPWLEEACARRQSLYHDKVRNPTALNIAAHKKLDKFCNKHINKAKSVYYKKFFDDHRDNSKKQWQLINGLLNRKSEYRDNIRLKDEHGNLLSTEPDVAARFNEYFSSIASNIKSQISARQTFDPGGFDKYLRNPVPNSIYLKPVAASEVHEIVNKLKNKATLDTKIGPMKIANGDFKFTETFAHVVNSSFNQGLFPNSLKQAKVVPIHKGGCTSNVANYRPISLLSSFSKIYEKLMHSRVLQFLDSNGSLFEDQYGFRPGMSCEHALLNAQNSILHSLNKNQIAVLLLLDYSKAFDVIEHSILIKKLEHYGIRGVALNWFSSYLSNRRQFVSINGTSSTTNPILYGVPQGSILGPLLFVIYINDLPCISNLAKFILYADDANIIVTGTTEEEVNQKLQMITSLLISWVDSNGLSLNLKKTHYMIFSHKKIEYSKIDVSIAGTRITRVTEARFLGVIIDEKLTWSKHIAAVRIKMSRYMGIMYRIKRHLPLKVRLQLFHSFVQSHLNFCSLVWGFASKSLINSLFTKQKQGVRMLMQGYVNYFYRDGQMPAHTKDSFKEHEILTIHGIVVRNTLILMHKIKHFPSTVPKSIKNLFPDIDNLPSFQSTYEESEGWLNTYGGPTFRSSIFFKGPLLSISETNKCILVNLSSLFSLKVYKAASKRKLIEEQSRGGEDNAWPNFLLHTIRGLRQSNRLADQN